MKHSKGIIMIVLVLLVLVLAGLLYSYSAKIKTYNLFAELYNTIYEGSIKAETANTLISNVWRNSIWKKTDSRTDKYTRKNGGSGKFYDDFNDAINNLYDDDGFIADLTELYSLKSKAESLIKKLSKHPRSFDEEYSDFKDCYFIFVKFTDMSLVPGGRSLDSFNDEHNELDKQIADMLIKLNLYFD